MTSRDRAEALARKWQAGGFEEEEKIVALIQRAIDEAMSEREEAIYAAVKRSFVAPESDEHGRPYSDVAPNAQVRIKAAIRARMRAS